MSEETPISSPEHEKLKHLFHKALEFEPEERLGFLEVACGADKELMEEVVAILRHREKAAERLESPFLHPVGQALPSELPTSLGDYEVLSPLGRGGMGVVYRARRRDGDSGDLEVALKVLRPGVLTAQHRSRFAREAEALRRLEHPYIARFLEAGVLETELGSQPYFSMEYVKGLGLRDYVAKHNPSETERIELLIKILHAVHHAHERGVVHRDLKPENILVDAEGEPHILDFGLALLSDTDLKLTTYMTGIGQLIGTIQYMSPEQASSTGKLDARSDIYALGVLGYELLTGELPYTLSGENIPQAIVTIVAKEAVPAGDRRPFLRGNVEAILERALKKRPHERYPSAEAMSEDLERHLVGKRISVRTSGPLRRRLRKELTRRRVRGGAAVVTVSLMVIAVLFLASWFWTQRTAPQAQGTLHSVCMLLDEAELERERSEWDEAATGKAIAMFEEARAQLSRLVPFPNAADLKRYMYWRLGELHYFVGEEEHDTNELSRAFAYFEGASGIDRSPGTLPVLDPGTKVHTHIARLGNHHPWVGRAFTASALARYRNPAKGLRRALLDRESALSFLNQPDNYDPQVAESDRAFDRASLLHALAIDRVALGAVLDSLGLIDEGMSSLRRANVEAQGGVPSASAASMHQWGEAWLQRAEVTQAQSDLDSARFWLSQALPRRDPGREHWRTGLKLARVSLLESCVSEGREERRALCREALAELEDTLPSLEGGGDDFERALTYVSMAEVKAEVDRETHAEFAAADSLLDAAQVTLVREKFPVQEAELRLTRAKLYRLRFESDHGAQDRERALRELRVARGLVELPDYPRLHRQIDDELARLGVPDPRSWQ